MFNPYCILSLKLEGPVQVQVSGPVLALIRRFSLFTGFT
jgi:hypothetical protein